MQTKDSFSRNLRVTLWWFNALLWTTISFNHCSTANNSSTLRFGVSWIYHGFCPHFLRFFPYFLSFFPPSLWVSHRFPMVFPWLSQICPGGCASRRRVSWRCQAGGRAGCHDIHGLYIRNEYNNTQTIISKTLYACDLWHSGSYNWNVLVGVYHLTLQPCFSHLFAVFCWYMPRIIMGQKKHIKGLNTPRPMKRSLQDRANDVFKGCHCATGSHCLAGFIDAGKSWRIQFGKAGDCPKLLGVPHCHESNPFAFLRQERERERESS